MTVTLSPNQSRLAGQSSNMPDVFRKGSTLPLLAGPLTVQLPNEVRHLTRVTAPPPQPSPIHLAVIQVATQRLAPTMDTYVVKVAHDLQAAQSNGHPSPLILPDLSSV